MKFNSQLFNFKKLYIQFYFLAVLNIFFSTENIYAKTFSINNIEISTPFQINFDKNEVIDEGFIQAFDQMIYTIVQTKDQIKLENISLNSIKGMIETFSIKEEKFIDNIYYLSLKVTFNKKRIFNFLQRKNIYPSLPIKKKVFLIPIILDQSKEEILMFSESYLFNNWNSNIKNYHLLEYILPTEDLEDFNLIKNRLTNLENYDFNEIIKKYNTKDFIITIVYKDINEIRVLNRINFDEKLYLKNLKFEYFDLNNENEIKKFTNELKNIYENYWKSKNEINTSVKSSFTISVDNTNNLKIFELEENLSNIDLIHNFHIYKFNNRNNIYKIIFNGSPDYFLKIMKDKNYEFDTISQIWKLK